MKSNDETFLARWLNDELTPEERSEFESNPDYAQFRKIVKGADALHSPEFDAEGLRARIELAKGKKSAKQVWWYAVAASVTLILGFFAFINWESSIQSGAGEQLAYDLPDGSSVFLNADSDLSLKKWGWESNRTLSLDGEAYFDVAKGSVFTVNTTLGDVTVLGTEFNVLTDAELLEVTCYEGRVSVAIGKTETILTVGQGVRFLSGELTESRHEYSAPGWRDGVSRFESLPLTYVINALQDQFDVEIQNQNLLNLDQTFTGQFPHNDLKVALAIVFKPLNIKYQLDGDQVYLEPIQ